MATRPSWEGFIRFNLISIPVKGYNAAKSGGADTGFHLLHKGCNERIHYKKVCPIHGEVPNSEIVSGYEVAKNEYAVVAKEERSELKAEDDKAITIAAFVPPSAVDPVFFNGHTWYLVPDGKVAEKPYVVILDAMREKDRYAVGQLVISGRSHLAVIRPSGKLLVLMQLSYEADIKKPSTFEEDIAAPAVTAKERDLAEMLITSATAEHFDLSQFTDEYSSKLAKLVEGKVKRAVRSSSTEKESPAVINLMDALRESLNMTQKDKGGKKKSTGSGKTERTTGKKQTV